jgi:cytochrome c1
MQMPDGMYYNTYYPGNQIAMPAPLSDDGVEYADGTPATVEQQAADITTFLTWAAEPNLESRKRTGVMVMVFLLIMVGLTYVTKRAVWRDVH